KPPLPPCRSARRGLRGVASLPLFPQRLAASGAPWPLARLLEAQWVLACRRLPGSVSGTVAENGQLFLISRVAVLTQGFSRSSGLPERGMADASSRRSLPPIPATAESRPSCAP